MNPIVFHPTVLKQPPSPPPPNPYMAHPYLRLVSNISHFVSLSLALIGLFLQITLPKTVNQNQLRKFHQTRIFLCQGYLAAYAIFRATVIMRAFLHAMHPFVFGYILFSSGVVFYCGIHIIRQSKEVLNLLDSLNFNQPVRNGLYQI